METPRRAADWVHRYQGVSPLNLVQDGSQKTDLCWETFWNVQLPTKFERGGLWPIMGAPRIGIFHVKTSNNLEKTCFLIILLYLKKDKKLFKNLQLCTYKNLLVVRSCKGTVRFVSLFFYITKTLSTTTVRGSTNFSNICSKSNISPKICFALFIRNHISLFY